MTRLNIAIGVVTAAPGSAAERIILKRGTAESFDGRSIEVLKTPWWRAKTSTLAGQPAISFPTAMTWPGFGFNSASMCRGIVVQPFRCSAGRPARPPKKPVSRLNAKPAARGIPELSTASSCDAISRLGSAIVATKASIWAWRSPAALAKGSGQPKNPPISGTCRKQRVMV
jgi:hypothetical protein